MPTIDLGPCGCCSSSSSAQQGWACILGWVCESSSSSSSSASGCTTDADCKFCPASYTYIEEANTCCPPGTEWGPWPPDNPSNPPACYGPGAVTFGVSPTNGYCCNGICKNPATDLVGCQPDTSQPCYEATYEDCERSGNSPTIYPCGCPIPCIDGVLECPEGNCPCENYVCCPDGFNCAATLAECPGVAPFTAQVEQQQQLTHTQNPRVLPLRKAPVVNLPTDRTVYICND
jgi:hypothetical protein